MKNRCVVCCCIFWFVSVAGGIAQDTLTVMTYNIYHGEHPETAGQSTVYEIGQLIDKQQPDFVALQEVDSMTTRLARLHGGTSFDLADSLATLTTMTGYFAKTIDFEGGGYGIAILSKEQFERRKILLPNPMEGEPRALLLTEGQTPSGNPIVFAAAHLDHQHEKNRLAQVGTINTKLANHKKTVILAGDFNFIPDSEAYKQMQNHWTDAGITSSRSNEPASTYPSTNPDKRIDYIWLSKNADWKLLKYKTLEVPFSDHLPVVARIVVN